MGHFSNEVIPGVAYLHNRIEVDTEGNRSINSQRWTGNTFAQGEGWEGLNMGRRKG